MEVQAIIVLAVIIIGIGAAFIKIFKNNPSEPIKSNEKLLNEAAENGQMIFAEVVGMETAETWKIDREKYANFRVNGSLFEAYDYDHIKANETNIINMATDAYHDIPDSRTSYMPIFSFSVGGEKYTVPYCRFIDEKEMALKDGDRVRIVYCKSEPELFIMQSDKKSYHYLPKIMSSTGKGS